jgi:hypothetical protein
MTEAIAAIYGSAVTPTLSRTADAGLYEEETGHAGRALGDATDSLVSYRSSSYATRFRLVMATNATEIAATRMRSKTRRKRVSVMVRPTQRIMHRSRGLNAESLVSK